MKMLKYKYYFLIKINLLLLLLMMGCVSISINKKDVEEQDVKAGNQSNANGGQIDDVRVSEFIIGVGDEIEISVYRHDELNSTVKIGTSGRIMFPLVGDVEAAGKSIFELRDELREGLSKYLIDPQVVINVTSVQSQKIMVLGEVNKPGVFTLDSDVSILEALANAGGVTSDAKIRNVLLVRSVKGKQEVASLNLKKIFKGDFSQDRALQGGDIIYVPAVVISNVSRYFAHLAQIINPFANLASGIVLWDQVIEIYDKDERGGSGGLPNRPTQ